MIRRWLISLSLVLLAAGAFAQTREERLDRVRELVALVEAEGTFRAAIDASVGQMRASILENFDAVEPQSEEMAAELEAKKKEIGEYFDRYTEILGQKIDWNRFQEEVVVPLYAKHFTHDEVQALLDFYRSPIGRKSLGVMPELMRESMQASASFFAPAMAETQEQMEREADRKHPWRPTMADMRSTATAMEAYATDNDHYPRATSLKELKALIEGLYIRSMPETDGWGNPFAVIVSPDGQHYRIVSAGADGSFEWDSRSISPVAGLMENEIVFSERLEDDIIYENGSFLQAPKQVQQEMEAPW